MFRELIFRVCFFFFNDTATTEIYTLSLHDALPIFAPGESVDAAAAFEFLRGNRDDWIAFQGLVGNKVGVDRKSTRLNSSHSQISYAVFCLKKKKQLRPRRSSRRPPFRQ